MTQANRKRPRLPRTLPEVLDQIDALRVTIDDDWQALVRLVNRTHAKIRTFNALLKLRDKLYSPPK